MPVTSQMNLTLPTVLSTAGPAYATQVNAALTQIDGHTHGPGQGSPVVAAGLNINADVSWHSNSLTFAKTVGFSPQTSIPGAGQYTSSLYVLNGELAYRNASGVDVTMTQGGVVRATNGFYGDYGTYGAQASWTNATQSYSLANPDTSLSKLSCAALTCAGVTSSATVAVTGNVTATGNIAATGALSGATTTLGATTATSLNVGAVTATANMTLGTNSLTVGAINATGRLNFTGTGDIQVAGTGSISTLSGAITSAGGLTSTGNTSFLGSSSNTFTITNSIPVTLGALTANGGVTVPSGQTTSTYNLTVTNGATVANASLSGATGLSGTFTLASGAAITNNGTSSFKCILGGFKLSAASLAAGGTTQMLWEGGASSAAYPFPPPFSGSVVGICAWASATATSTLTFTLTKSGGATAFTTSGSITTSSSALRNTAARNAYPFAATDNLRIDVTSSAAVSVTAEAWLILEMTL